MKKTERKAGKNPLILKGTRNKLLPAQVNKQLKKHYVNKYGVMKKSKQSDTYQT